MIEEESPFAERHPSRNDRSGWRGGGSRPGWSEAWRWRHDHRPQWWHERAVFPLFLWAAQSPRGSWQCTAFDQNQIPYTSAASTQDAAAYNALYDCGGRNYEDECYIPEGYCQYRY
ncbi:MAG: hypothetical protein AABY64_09245 [Bdellovibrionota bacterium]